MIRSSCFGVERLDSFFLDIRSLLFSRWLRLRIFFIVVAIPIVRWSFMLRRLLWIVSVSRGKLLYYLRLLILIKALIVVDLNLRLFVS